MKRQDKDTATSIRNIRRRTFLLGSLQVGVLGALGWRMHQLQVEEADMFRLLAEENRINYRLLPPTRGLIFDRNGVLLAGNEPNYRVVIVREDAGDPDLVLGRLAQIIDLPDERIESTKREMSRRSAFVPITVIDRISWEEFSKVAVNAPALPGITPEVGLSRYYPLGKDFAHVVGYVGPVSEYDLQNLDDTDPLLQIPRFQIGKTGVESKLESNLRGAAGTRRVEVNAAGRIMRELDRDASESGQDLQLTVDYRIQNFVEERMKGQSAAAVVIDVETGGLVAMASAPSFDPNGFVRGISSTNFNALLNNEYRPLANKSVQGTYPPGSTFKMATTLAALKEGVIDPEELIYCGGFIELGNRRFHCWKRGGHGRVDLAKSLRESCDVYYYEVAQRVGIEKISAMARKLGLGERYDLPVNGIAAGLVPTKSWKVKNRGEDWLIGDTLNSTIGQGFVLTSPLQLAVMTARIASGRAVQPTLLRSVNARLQPAALAEPLDIDPDHLAIVRDAMDQVSNVRTGTAYRSRSNSEETRIAGKTGTSQVFSITAAERATGVIETADLPWNRRDHALFVGFGPVQSPKYAVSVVVEHGGGGSTVAAPIARDILLFAQRGDLPPLTDYPRNQRDRIAKEQEVLELIEPLQMSSERTRA